MYNINIISIFLLDFFASAWLRVFAIPQAKISVLFSLGDYQQLLFYHYWDIYLGWIKLLERHEAS